MTLSISIHACNLNSVFLLIAEKRKRPDAICNANLQSKKTCPDCGKVYGNAKRTACGADVNGTKCGFIFGTNADAKSACQGVADEPMPNKPMSLRDITGKLGQFQKKVRPCMAVTDSEC